MTDPVERSHPRCWVGDHYEHTCHQPSGRPCAEGCGRQAGTPWSDLWCPECDVVRLDRVSEGLSAARAYLTERGR